jgi:hypothetical protein
MTYDLDNKFSYWLNSIMSNRISQSKMAVDQLGIHLFGTKFSMIGSYSVENLGGYLENYFYVDSGYLYSILAYGVIISFVIFGIYTFVFYAAYKENNKELYIWTMIILILNFSNDFLFNVQCIPIVFVISNTFIRNKKFKFDSNKN